MDEDFGEGFSTEEVLLAITVGAMGVDPKDISDISLEVYDGGYWTAVVQLDDGREIKSTLKATIVNSLPGENGKGSDNTYH